MFGTRAEGRSAEERTKRAPLRYSNKTPAVPGLGERHARKMTVSSVGEVSEAHG